MSNTSWLWKSCSILNEFFDGSGVGKKMKFFDGSGVGKKMKFFDRSGVGKKMKIF